MPDNKNNIAHAAPQEGQISASESAQTATPDSVVSAVAELIGDEPIQTPQDTSPQNGTPTETPDDQTPQNDDGNPPPENADDENADDGSQPPENPDEDENPDDANAGDEDADDENPEGFTPEQQAVFNRAQKKLRSKLQNARAERDSFKSENENLKAQLGQNDGQYKKLLAEKVVPVGQSVPLPDIQTLDELKNTEAQAWEVYSWADANESNEPKVDEDGNEYVASVKLPDGKERRFTAAEIRELKRKADATIRRDIPSRAQFLQTNESFNRRLEKFFPDLKNPETELSREINSVIIKLPAIKALPGYKQAALSFYLGQKLLLAAQDKSFDVLKKAIVMASQPPSKKSVIPAASRKPAAPAVSRNPTPPAPAKVFKRSTPETIADDIVGIL